MSERKRTEKVFCIESSENTLEDHRSYSFERYLQEQSPKHSDEESLISINNVKALLKQLKYFSSYFKQPK